MTHFAQIENGIVTNIILVAEEDSLDNNGNFNEGVGANFCSNLIEGTWVRSGNTNSPRKNTAVLGCTFDVQRDAFIYEQPFSSWVFDEVSCNWEAPVEYPTDDPTVNYSWDEDSVSWILETPPTE